MMHGNTKTLPPELPNLQKLVEAYGGWLNIPPEAWKIFDEQMKQWKGSVRHGDRWFDATEGR